MQKKIIFHIGGHKSGSTTIQHYLRKHHGGYGEPLRFPISGRAGGASPDHKRLNDRAPDHKSHWMALEKEIISDKVKNSVFILSDESASWSDPQFFKKQLDPLVSKGIDVKFLMYARPHVGAIKSHFSQMAKSGKIFNFSDFIESHIKHRRFDYKYIYDSFSDVFGEENVKLRPFARDLLHGGDAVLDLLNYVKEISGHSIEYQPIKNANATYGVFWLCFVREYIENAKATGKISNPKELEQVIFELTRTLNPLVLSIYNKTKVWIPKELLKMLKDSYRLDAEWLDEHLQLGSYFSSALQEAEAEGPPYEEISRKLLKKAEIKRLDSLLNLASSVPM